MGTSKPNSLYRILKSANGWGRLILVLEMTNRMMVLTIRMMVLTNRMMVLIIRCRFKVDYCFPIFSSSHLVYYLMSKWQLRPSAFFYRINFMHMTTSVSQIKNIICITFHVRGQHSEKRGISIQVQEPLHKHGVLNTSKNLLPSFPIKYPPFLTYVTTNA